MLYQQNKIVYHKLYYHHLFIEDKSILYYSFDYVLINYLKQSLVSKRVRLNFQ